MHELTIVLSLASHPVNYSLAGTYEVSIYSEYVCLRRFIGIGVKKILGNRQVVMTLDNNVQNKSEKVGTSKTWLDGRILKNMSIFNNSQKNREWLFTQQAEE